MNLKYQDTLKVYLKIKIIYWIISLQGSGEIHHSGNQNHGTIDGATWEEVVSWLHRSICRKL